MIADMEEFETEAVVIGAGVVGLAVARALALKGMDVVVIERHGHPGEETSSRNSEVIHAGLYYTPGSLKARLCREGRDRLYAYCRDRNLPHRQCGKWIVATEAEQEERLHRLAANAEENGVMLEPVSSAALAGVPDLRAFAALSSPLTGIIDSHAFMQALIADIESSGGWLVFNTPVERVSTPGPHRHELWLGGEAPCRLRARYAINASGLEAADLARRWDGTPKETVPEQYLARGHYFTYAGRHPFDRLIYPLPGDGGLGVHLTLDLAGQARFGPDVQWVDRVEYSVAEGLATDFAASIRSWWPGMDPDRLAPGYAGIRPKLSGPGEPAADFRIDGPAHHGLAGLVHLFGIESPGLTASLAMADEVCRRLLDE